MELILLSSPVSIPDELTRLNDYFHLGLKGFHLRKPYYSIEKLEGFLNEIDPQYYSSIVLHSHHSLGEKFGIKRFHYPEDLRTITTKEALAAKVSDGNIISTSVHSIEALSKLPTLFSYAFIGPVFPSISKRGYGDPFNAAKWSRINNSNISAIAIGGVSGDNITVLKKLGFKGAGILGIIWTQAHENAIEELKYCLHHVQKLS